MLIIYHLSWSWCEQLSILSPEEHILPVETIMNYVRLLM